MKPRFEEYEGQLFRMLEEPTPLTPDAEMPCLVRLIQDDSLMGRYNRDASYSDVIGKLYVAQKIKENPYYSNTLHAYYKDSNGKDSCIASIHQLEIIGTFVEEGSADWALYQMMQGKKVSHKGAIGNVCWALNQDGDVQYYDMDDLAYIGTIRSKLEFGERKLQMAGKTGWQIYEPEQPKPLLADTGIGDIVKTNLGDWLQIVDTPRLRFGHDECYRTHDGLYWDEYGVCDVDSTYKLVAVEPLAPEGTAEWAWQMLKLQKPVSHPAEGELQDTDYTKEGFVRCMAKTGWQLYEPKPQPDKEDMHLRSGKDNPERQDICHMYEPQPEPQYKVGDWVEFIDVGGRKSQGKYLSNTDGNAIIVLETTCNMRVVVHTTNIIRKLSPSEIVVRIGCLSGTVRRINDIFFCLNPSTEKGWVVPEATIPLAMLDTPTRKIVESLLKAQEEEE